MKRKAGAEDENDQLYDLRGWAEYSDSSQLNWTTANHSDVTWRVCVQPDGSVTAQKYARDTKRQELLSRVPAAIFNFNYGWMHRGESISCAIQVPNGWLIGLNAGEWGGGLWWVSEMADSGYKIKSDNIKDLICSRDGKYYALVGLAHLSMSNGALFEVAYAMPSEGLCPVIDLSIGKKDLPGPAWRVVMELNLTENTSAVLWRDSESDSVLVTQGRDLLRITFSDATAQDNQQQHPQQPQQQQPQQLYPQVRRLATFPRSLAMLYPESAVVVLKEEANVKRHKDREREREKEEEENEKEKENEKENENEQEKEKKKGEIIFVGMRLFVCRIDVQQLEEEEKEEGVGEGGKAVDAKITWYAPPGVTVSGPCQCSLCKSFHTLNQK